jgi:hypothetical protein
MKTVLSAHYRTSQHWIIDIDWVQQPTDWQWHSFHVSTYSITFQGTAWGRQPYRHLWADCLHNWIPRSHNPLWREGGSLVNNCCLAWPAQSFSGSSTAKLMTIFYCFKCDTLKTSRAWLPYLFLPGNSVTQLYPQNRVAQLYSQTKVANLCPQEQGGPAIFPQTGLPIYAPINRVAQLYSPKQGRQFMPPSSE